MRICILDWTTVTSGDIDYNIFSEFGDVSCYPLTDNDKAAEYIGNAEMVLCNKVMITREVMNRCPDIKYIGLFATGYNNIDIKAADEKGIVVCNAGEYSTNAVAQQTFAYILEHFSRISEYDRFVKAGGWIASKTFSKFPIKTQEISGKTLAVVGFGSIGRKVARIADAFGMNVIVNTRTQPLNCEYELVSLEEAFSRADVLTIHCPLTEKTGNMVNARNLSLMKDGALLINTARGGIVNESDLAYALQSGRIYAALDVLEQEPMSDTTPLKNAPNCIITPHTAWASLETRSRLIDIVCSNIRAWLDGKPQNRVN
ncbi:MAG: D-2-hydroxyacid dehydrogenase [Clostridium sp.]|nr:D-2-hydroxyacid dehydrogenase [Clostridium sp.]MCM1547678.1 D-2-hydroxyacid dehydrogenase [Ruminococcus sp.]